MTSVPHALEASEPFIRLVCFVAVLAAMAAWETRAPRRSPAIGRSVRWPNNLGLVALNTALVRVLVPTAAVGLALVAEAEGWGLLNRVAVPVPARVAVSVILLDLAMYLQHVLFHAAPGLWRLHRMHHADLDVDVTTGVRFHPIEILLSMGIKLAIIAVPAENAQEVADLLIAAGVRAILSYAPVVLQGPDDVWVRYIDPVSVLHSMTYYLARVETDH